MDAFSYLSILISIIVGLAITQVLQGYRALLLSRSRVRLFAPPLLWSALLLMFATQAWWACFGLRDHAEWSFATFAVILLQMVMIYMMAAVILPDIGAGDAIDLRAHFQAHRKWFFGFLLGMLAASILKSVMLNGALPGVEDLTFHFMLAVTAVLGIALGGPRSQLVLALVTLLGFVSYVALLFARL